jgi:hypothetical protein
MRIVTSTNEVKSQHLNWSAGEGGMKNSDKGNL